jgi:hypothetical protein
VTQIKASLWGAGGAGSAMINSGAVRTGMGAGGGGYAEVYIPVTAGQTYEIVVGSGSTNPKTTTATNTSIRRLSDNAMLAVATGGQNGNNNFYEVGQPFQLGSTSFVRSCFNYPLDGGPYPGVNPATTDAQGNCLGTNYVDGVELSGTRQVIRDKNLPNNLNPVSGTCSEVPNEDYDPDTAEFYGWTHRAFGGCGYILDGLNGLTTQGGAGQGIETFYPINLPQINRLGGLGANSAGKGGDGGTTGAGGVGENGRADITVFTSSATVPFDFSITNGGNKTISAGSNVQNSITTTLSTPTTGSVRLNVDSIRDTAGTSFLNTANGFTATLLKNTLTPTEVTTLTLNSSATTPAGVYTVVVSGANMIEAPYTNDCNLVYNVNGTMFYYGCDNVTGFDPKSDYIINGPNSPFSDVCIISENANGDQSPENCFYKVSNSSGYTLGLVGQQFVIDTRTDLANFVCGPGNWTLNGNANDYHTDFICSNPVSSNKKTTTFTITVVKPDLIPNNPPNAPTIISGTTNPNGSYVIGTDISFNVQPKNIGATFTTPNFTVKLQKKTAGSADTSYVDTASTATVTGGLVSNTFVDKTIAYTSLVGDTNGGGYDFRYCVDSTNAVNESDEGNNCSASVLAVKFQTPPAVGTIACVRDSVSPTTQLNLTWTQSNGSNVSIFKSPGGTLVQTVSGSSGSVSDPGLTPATAYTYYLRNGNQVTSPLLASVNCSTAGVASVNLTAKKSGTATYSAGPLSVNYGVDNVDLTWTGTNLAPGATCTPNSWTAVTAVPGSQAGVGPLTNATYSYSISCGGVTSNSVVVNVGLPSATCASSASGNTITWTATPSPVAGGAISYTYSWSGTDALSGITNPISKTYSTSGVKTANVVVTGTGSRTTAPISCNGGSGVTIKPDLIPNNPPNAPTIISGTTNPNGSYVIGTDISFNVQPKNIGATFTTPNFTVKLQKKTAGSADTSYVDTASTATVTGGLVSNTFVDKTIAYTSLVGDTNGGGYDFRYCVDSTNAVDESNEGNNCSGQISSVRFEPVFVPVVSGVSSSATCSVDGIGRLNVSWSSVANVDGYRVYRGASSTFVAGAGNLVATVSTNYFTDSGLTIGTNYFYKVIAYRGSSTSAAASTASTAAAPAPRCTDLVVTSVSTKVGGVATTRIVEGDLVTFSAVITNQGGATNLDFSNTFELKNSSNATILFANVSNPGGLAAATNVTIDTPGSKSWLAAAGTYSVTVCADNPYPDSVTEDNAGGDAESNNCNSASPLVINVLPQLSVNMEVGKLPLPVTYKGNYVIVNYSDLGSLRWSLTGAPNSCSGLQDLVGAQAVSSYPVTGNPLTISSFASKNKFVYQLNCSRP